MEEEESGEVRVCVFRLFLLLQFLGMDAEAEIPVAAEQGWRNSAGRRRQDEPTIDARSEFELNSLSSLSSLSSLPHDMNDG